jgi:multiple sugar transport system substrate-binding protein
MGQAPNDKSIGIDRRAALQAIGGTVLAASAVGSPLSRAVAQGPKTIRFWTTQSAPLQQDAYKAIFKAFEATNPGLNVAIELVSDNDAWPKITAAFAGGDVPDLVAHFVGPSVITLHAKGLVEPMDEVIKAVGEDAFFANARDIYKDKDGYFATCISNNSQVMWYRKDLLEAAGMKVPVYWDELTAVAKATTKNGVFGACLPYGKVGFANRFVFMLIQQAGGNVIAPDLSVAFDSPETVATFEWLKEMYQYCPPGSAGYSFGDVLGAYVSGRVATAVYSGRPLINVSTDNPSLGDKISCAFFPYRRGGQDYGLCAFDSLIIPKGAKNVAEARKLAAWMYRPDSYIRFLHATPGHHLPVLKSVAQSPAYSDQPLLKKYAHEIEVMTASTARSRNEIKPTDRHPFIGKAGEITGSNIIAETLQKVVVEKTPTKLAVSWGADQIAKVMKA